MRDTAIRVYALAATAVLLAMAVLALRVAAPPYKRIQRDRVAEQIIQAQQELATLREDFDHTKLSLDYSRAEQAVADAREELDRSSGEVESLLEELDLLEHRRTFLVTQQVDLLPEAEAEAAHEAYVRLTGTPGAIADEVEQARLAARAARGSDRLEEIDGIDDQRRRIEARLRELQAPTRAAQEALAAFREDLDRGEARLARLETWEAEIHEIYTPAGDVERCTTCHPGMDDLGATHASLGADSPFAGWGCTPCHGGNGRALKEDAAHHNLTLRPWTRGPAYSLEPVIAQLDSSAPRQRADAAAFLRRETGRSFGYQYHAPEPERADAVRSWCAWWAAAEGYYRPERPAGLVDHGHDAAGRPLQYVGSGACLRCHEARQRQHVRRWRETKFVSMDRLDEVEDTTPCLPCHTTGYDEHSGTYVQGGVTCEGCHGPGAGYSSAMQAAVVLQSLGAEEEGERLLDDVSTQLREQMARHNVCVECHDPFGVKELVYEHKQ